MFLFWPLPTVLETLNQRVMEYKKQLASERADLDTTREQLSRAQAQEASLVHQNGRMSMELVAAEKREKKLEKQVSGLEKRLSTEGARFAKVEEEWKSEKLKQEKELERVQKELNEKSKVLREYQDKVNMYMYTHHPSSKGWASGVLLFLCVYVCVLVCLCWVWGGGWFSFSSFCSFLASMLYTCMTCIPMHNLYLYIQSCIYYSSTVNS